MIYDFTVARGNLAADEDIVDACGSQCGFRKGGTVLNLLQIKDGDVRVRAHIQAALVLPSRQKVARNLGKEPAALG